MLINQSSNPPTSWTYTECLICELLCFLDIQTPVNCNICKSGKEAELQRCMQMKINMENQYAL